MLPRAFVAAAVCIAASVATLAPVSAREVVDQQFGTAGISLSAYGTSVRDSEVLAWDFCVNFARDNNLQVLPGRSVRRGPAQG
jgi:hypothetical protein